MSLRQADLSSEDVTWVHAHGTGSIHNDLAEAKAIRKLFQQKTPPVSSTKAVHGHALAATGAIETIICIKALEEGIILRTPGLKNPDPDIPVRHPQENTRTQIRHILKSTLGFGGTNGALVISFPKEGEL